MLDEILVKVFLARQGPLTRAENLVFKIFQLRRDIALSGLQCLASNVLERCFVGLRLADFDVITVHAVVAEFQRRDTSALTFAKLKVNQVLVCVFRNRAQIIELIVVSRRNNTAVADQHGWAVNNRFAQQMLLLFVFAYLAGEVS